jgi:uncharacterized membrane protein YdbT with pleckstrin-like domain
MTEIKEKEVEIIGKSKKLEEPDILRVRNTRKLYIPFYIMVLVLLLTIIYIKISGRFLNPLALNFSLLFSFLLIIGTEIHRLGHSYEINDHSIIHKYGYFSTVSKTMQFGAISDSDVEQDLWQRIFSYGNIEIHLYSKQNTSLIKNINKPFNFVAFLQMKLKSAGGRKR